MSTEKNVQMHRTTAARSGTTCGTLRMKKRRFWRRSAISSQTQVVRFA